MKTRDRVISAVVVGVIIGGIWVGGAKLRGEQADADAATDANAEASTSTITSTSDADTSTSTTNDASLTIDAAVMSGACRALMDATDKKLADAKSTRACTPAFDTSSLACRTSQNGATWGLRVDDVVDLGGDACATGWLVRLVHVDVNAIESAVVPGLSSTVRAHTIDVTSETRVDDVTFFDWDGDGEDEVYVHAARGNGDRADEERATIFTFHPADAGAHIAPYPPAQALAMQGIQDVDTDGRPDVIVSIFGTGKDAPPTSRRFAAHSLADGTFTLHDAAAIAWAEKQCPKDPGIDLDGKTADDFDAALADSLACALVWGHDAKTVGAAIAKACNAPEAGTCPSWARTIAKTKPPLSLR